MVKLSPEPSKYPPYPKENIIVRINKYGLVLSLFSKDKAYITIIIIKGIPKINKSFMFMSFCFSYILRV